MTRMAVLRYDKNWWDIGMIRIGGIDVTEGIIVTTFLIVLLCIFYLYKKENRIIMWFLVLCYKPHPAELKKDTGTQDWLLLIAMLILVMIMGIKLVTLMVVVSDSMKPEFERGDIIITQSFNLTPSPGDIITFHVDDEANAVSHRVVSVSNKGKITTRGDNNGYTDKYNTMQKDVIAKAIIYDDHPIVIKKFGALFITDYKGEGIIFKWGDRFTFMQQLSATIKAWGYIITVIAIIAYILMMKK